MASLATCSPLEISSHPTFLSILIVNFPVKTLKLANREYPGGEEISLSLIMKQEGRGQGTTFKRIT